MNNKISKPEYKNYIKYASSCSANRVYPMSIAEETQNGDIYVLGDIVLFWHYAGFAYVYGQADPVILENIYHEFFRGTSDRRFLLITDDVKIVDFYQKKDGLQFRNRIEYRFGEAPVTSKAELNHHLVIEKITLNNISKIHGKIIPSFSWDNIECFLDKGFGYVALDGEKAAAVAFSSAVSSTEIDIGVETDENYRHMGLAKALSHRMCEEILHMEKKPVWAHAESNMGSKNTAIGVGFIPCKVNTVIQRITP